MSYRIIPTDERTNIYKDNKLVGYVDEGDVLYRFAADGYAVEVGPVLATDKIPAMMDAPPVDPVVERVRSMLLERSQLGIIKYGMTLADNKLTLRQWLQHALEEALDQANYMQAAIMKLDGEI